MTIAGVLFILAFFLGRSRRVFPFILVLAAGSEYIGNLDLMGLPKILSAAAGLGLVVWHRPVWPPRIYVGRALLVMALWMCASIMWSPYKDVSLVRISTPLSLVVLYFTVILYMRETEDVLQFWVALLAFTAADAALSVFNLYTGQVFIELETGVRTAGLMANPNDSAFVSALGLCLLLVGSFRPDRSRVWYGSMWVTMPLAILLGGASFASGSRSGILSGLCGALFIMWSGCQIPEVRKKIMRKSWLIILGSIVSLLLFSAEVLGTLSRFEASSEDRLGGRVELYSYFLGLIQDSPIVGHGLNTGPKLAERQWGMPMSTHNSYITILVEYGLVGALLGAAVLALIVRALRSDGLSATPFFFDRIVLLGFFVASLIFGLSGDQVLNKFVWLLIGVIDSVYGLRRARSQVGRMGIRKSTGRRSPPSRVDAVRSVS